jgi:hypothetical protein
MKLLSLILALTLLTGCAKKVTAPVPGTINTFDAYAARSIGDAQEAIMATKAWETCSDQKFPAQVIIDGETRACDASGGAFPQAGRPILFKAETSYNVALAAAQSYHSGATGDTTGLAQALTQLGVDIGTMLNGIGRGK